VESLFAPQYLSTDAGSAEVLRQCSVSSVDIFVVISRGGEQTVDLAMFVSS
jgi:hypothetical protein